MRTLEQFLVDLDGGCCRNISRLALGLTISPVSHGFLGARDRVWPSLVVFVGMLVLLRVVPAILRRALPFSVDASKVWAERRNIAKQFDSYQWQKLFWIGLGLLLYAAIGGGLTAGELFVTSICLIGGSAGLLAQWRISRAFRKAKKERTPPIVRRHPFGTSSPYR